MYEDIIVTYVVKSAYNHLDPYVGGSATARRITNQTDDSAEEVMGLNAPSTPVLAASWNINLFPNVSVTRHILIEHKYYIQYYLLIVIT